MSSARLVFAIVVIVVLHLADTQRVTLPFSCSFEEGFCNMLQPVRPNDWTRCIRASAEPWSGPLEAADGEWFIYSQGNRESNSNWIQTPGLEYYGTACTRFQYAMVGLDNSTSLEAGPDRVESVFHRRNDNPGLTWKSAALTVEDVSPGYVVMFVAAIDSRTGSGVAIDDITITEGACKDSCSDTLHPINDSSVTSCCRAVEKLFTHNLYECLERSCESATANTLTYRDSECVLRRCEPEEYQLTPSDVMWDVYVRAVITTNDPTSSRGGEGGGGGGGERGGGGGGEGGAGLLAWLMPIVAIFILLL